MHANDLCTPQENDALTSEELTPMELEVARKSWEEGIYSVPRPIIREAPM